MDCFLSVRDTFEGNFTHLFCFPLLVHKNILGKCKQNWAPRAYNARSWVGPMHGWKEGQPESECRFFSPASFLLRWTLRWIGYACRQGAQMVSVLHSKFLQRGNRAIKNIACTQKPSSALLVIRHPFPQMALVFYHQGQLLPASYTNVCVRLLPLGVCAAVVINFIAV